MRLRPLISKVKKLSFRPYRHLIFASDRGNWVLDREIKEIKSVALGFGISAQTVTSLDCYRQSIYYHSKYFLRKPEKLLMQKVVKRGNRFAFPYFHGYPSSGETTAMICFENLKKHHHQIDRIQVSHTYMRDVILDTGIDPQKVFLIPIGINISYFNKQTSATRKKARKKYGIPQSAVVIGSFQKDGNGWGEGLEPKMIKGPDVFLKAVGILKQSAPELFVLLSGPARGYIKKGLERLRIPHKHLIIKHYAEIGHLYQCLDLYMVASREEGGPKAILETMASGVPLVTTRVGQAMDLVKHGKNGMIVDVEDVKGLAREAITILSENEKREQMVRNGIQTALDNTYLAQTPLWREFFKGFVYFRDNAYRVG